MRNHGLWARLLIVVGLILLAGACGGETVPEPEPAVDPAPTPEPPGDQDIDIQPGSVTMGDTLSGTITAHDRLPPQAFGAIKDFVLEKVEPTTVDLDSIELHIDADHYITISNSGGSVSWTRTEPNAQRGQPPVVTLLTPYDPADNSNDCALMSSNLKPYFDSGVSLKFTYGTNKTAGTGSLAKNGTETPMIKFTTTPAAGTCAPDS